MVYDEFKNFETYLVAMWISECPASRAYWQMVVTEEERRSRDRRDDYPSDLSHEAIAELQIEQRLRSAVTAFPYGDIGGRLIDAACRRIDWQEMVTHAMKVAKGDSEDRRR